MGPVSKQLQALDPHATMYVETTYTQKGGRFTWIKCISPAEC
jgi:hypothetical protein